uniref:Uncharacterized protein n=1 Tax=Cacopsylla melanoneura TaxID=428564 RepID=A0A8D8S8E7_9HEMI
MKDLFFVNLYFEYELNRECILLNRFSIVKVAVGSLRPRLTTTTRLSLVISREQSARFSRNDNSDACRRVGRDRRYPNATFQGGVTPWCKEGEKLSYSRVSIASSSAHRASDVSLGTIPFNSVLFLTFFINFLSFHF